MITKIAILFLTFNMITIAPVPVNWQQKYVKNNITVFARDVEGSKYIASRAEMVVNTNLNQLLSLLQSFDSYPELVHNCVSAKLIENVKDNYIIYLTFDAPWPLTDRDVYLSMNVSRDDDNTVTIDLSDIKGYDSNKGYVRISKLDGTWILDPLGSSQVKIVFQIHMNPSSNVPAWIVNNSADDQVYYTMLNIRDRIMR